MKNWHDIFFVYQIKSPKDSFDKIESLEHSDVISGDVPLKYEWNFQQNIVLNSTSNN